VNRAALQGLLEELVRRLNDRERFLLALAPAETRRRVERWKSGFHGIARPTGALIVPVALDFGLREVRFGPPLAATADCVAGFPQLHSFYAGVTPRCPKNFERMQG